MARRPFTAAEAIAALEAQARPQNRMGMARFGIRTDRALGVSMPDIRRCAAQIAPDHQLAEQLWQSALHEARILAGLVDRPQWVTRQQMDRWTADFDSWDLCDQICGNLWDRTPHADDRIRHWATDGREFVRRAAFATIAWRAVHDRAAADAVMLSYLPLIAAAATDERNFVKKAVNWALRQIGKRSRGLHGPCLAMARELASGRDKTARWIGADAARELQATPLLRKLGL